MGQKRRAALARLMLSRAPLWFLDEPLTSLDAAAIGLVGELLERHLAGGGLVVYATHQPMPLKAIRPRVLVLGEAG
jgi:heme exporter protein A